MNKIRNLGIFIVAFSVLMIGASAVSTLGSISPVFASTDNSNKDQSNNDQSNNDQSIPMINLVQVKQIMNNQL